MSCSFGYVKCNRLKRADTVLRILETRCGAFEVLLEALENGIQWETARILQDSQPGRPPTIDTDMEISAPILTQNAGYSISRIVRIARDSDVICLLPSFWKLLAVDLGIPVLNIVQVESHLIYFDLNAPELFRTLLETWVSMKGTQATLESLLTALRECNAMDVAGLLENEFYDGRLVRGATILLQDNQDTSHEGDKTSGESELNSVIGEPGIEIHRVVDLALNAESGCVLLYDKLQDLIGTLGVDLFQRRQWGKEMVLGVKTPDSVLENALLHWVSKNGKKATLSAFVKILRQLRYNEISDHVLTEVKQSPKSTSEQVSETCGSEGTTLNAWPNTIIDRTLPQLLRTIQCTPQLLIHLKQPGGITSMESEIIKMQNIANGDNPGAVLKLLEILKNRVNGFKILVSSLENTQQNEALKYLLENRDLKFNI